MNPVNIYVFKDNNRNTRKRSENMFKVNQTLVFYF